VCLREGGRRDFNTSNSKKYIIVGVWCSHNSTLYLVVLVALFLLLTLFSFIAARRKCLRFGWLPSDRICLHVAELEQVGHTSKNI
jgi:hypothetical protein